MLVEWLLRFVAVIVLIAVYLFFYDLGKFLS